MTRVDDHHAHATRRGGRPAALLLAIALGAGPALGREPIASWHYACGDGIAANHGASGFNLADVNYVAKLNALPHGAKGLVWLGLCGGVNAEFKRTVRPFIGNPRVYGFYLMDEPDPRRCPASNLKAESDYVHAYFPGAKSFIVLMGFGSSTNPTYKNTYGPWNTGIDLYGVDPYPCRSEVKGCRYSDIPKAVEAAIEAGIPREAIVPFYQAFGGGNWPPDDGGGQATLPTVEQEKQILKTWGEVTPSPAFEAVYAWGSQQGDKALESAPALQAVFAAHNALKPSATASPQRR